MERGAEPSDRVSEAHEDAVAAVKQAGIILKQRAPASGNAAGLLHAHGGMRLRSAADPSAADQRPSGQDLPRDLSE